MRIRAAMVLTVVITASALILGGCGESKAAKEARLKGIEQVKNEDYASAVESFDLALKEADGVVNAFELDILKYRGEAEFMLEDYEAAAHTYGILADVDVPSVQGAGFYYQKRQGHGRKSRHGSGGLCKSSRGGERQERSSGRSGGGSLFHSGCIQNGR